MPKICIIGGGSLSWTHTVVKDLMYVFPEPLDIRLHDINLPAARLSQQLCALIGTKLKRQKDRIRAVGSRAEALRGADAVIITISTGRLAAMAHDIRIPEKYGIQATVGDTTGPGGWGRAVRNIPVFVEFARDFTRYCPQAFIVNYTNPMAALTATLELECANPVVGLCHSYFETKDVIARMFGLPDWKRISVTLAGMNHFTWVPDFTVDHRDGYPLLRQKLRGRSLHTLMPKISQDEIGYRSSHELCSVLYNTYGYLCYPADRHTSEFTSFALVNRKVERHIRRPGLTQQPVLDYCHLVRTPMAYRRRQYANAARLVKRILQGREQPEVKQSRETGTKMIAAFLRNEPFTEAVNVQNVGQVPGLPAGACIETLGTIDGAGVRPLTVKHVPEKLLELMRPHAVCQKWITDGARTGDKDMLLQALYRDPSCAHLTPDRIRKMADELLQAHRRFVHPRLR